MTTIAETLKVRVPGQIIMGVPQKNAKPHCANGERRNLKDEDIQNTYRKVRSDSPSLVPNPIRSFEDLYLLLEPLPQFFAKGDIIASGPTKPRQRDQVLGNRG